MNKYIFTFLSEDDFEIMTIISSFTTLQVEDYYLTYLKPMRDVLADQMEEKITYIVEDITEG